MNIPLTLEDAKAKALEFKEQGCKIAWSLTGDQNIFATAEDAISHTKRSSIFMHVYDHVVEMLDIERIIADHIEHDFSDVLRTHYSAYGDSVSLDLPARYGVELEEIQEKLNSIVRELEIYHNCMYFKVDISPWNLTVSALTCNDLVVIGEKVFRFIGHSTCGNFGAFWVEDSPKECQSFSAETPVTRCVTASLY